MPIRVPNRGMCAMDGKETLEYQEVASETPPNGAVDETVSGETAPESAPKKRSRGRPKGSVNKINKIARQAISDAAPHAFLIKIMQGRQFMRAVEEGVKYRVKCFPTLRESTTAAEILLRKVSPDMRAVEIGGIPDGEPVGVKRVDWNDLDLARRIALILSRNDPANRQRRE